MKCPYCGKEAEWLANEAVYGKRYGRSYMCWVCKDCLAYVGCHQNTKVPLGTMAKAELREWRVKAHKRIDPLWQKSDGLITRKKVYAALRAHFGRDIHIGEADIETCKRIVAIDEVYLIREE